MNRNTTYNNPRPYLEYLSRAVYRKMIESRYIQPLIARDFDAIRKLEFKGDGLPFADLSNEKIDALLKSVFSFKEFFQIANDLDRKSCEKPMKHT